MQNMCIDICYCLQVQSTNVTSKVLLPFFGQILVQILNRLEAISQFLYKNDLSDWTQCLFKRFAQGKSLFVTFSVKKRFSCNVTLIKWHLGQIGQKCNLIQIQVRKPIKYMFNINSQIQLTKLPTVLILDVFDAYE